MKIGIIGGAGFIGGELVKHIENNGHEAVVIERDLDVFSLNGREKAKEILSLCDAMAFLAAKRPDICFTMEEYIFNLTLAEEYFRISAEAGIDNIVTVSSRSVYSGMGTPWKEETFSTPLSLYGASKQAVDSIALLYNRQYGLKIKSLRIAQVIGMGERKGYLINTLIDNAIAGRKQTIFGKGIGKRQYIYIKDVCDAILHSLIFKASVEGIFNISMSNNISIIELAEIINEVFGNGSGIELKEDRPEDTAEYLMDVSKTERVLCWKPSYDLRRAFADIRESWSED